MNNVLFDKLVDHIESLSYQRNDMDYIIDEIKKDPKNSIVSIEQIILKAIQSHNDIPRENMKFLQKLFFQLFNELGDQLNNKKLLKFYDSFLDFFALGIQSRNHKLKTTFVTFLKIMIERYPKQKFSKQKSDNLYQACVSLFSETQIERKKLAIEILQLLQFQDQYQEEIESYFLKIIAEESSESLRKYALSKISINKQNINFLSHRIKDVSLEIRSLLMDKLIFAENIHFKDLDKNSLYFLIYNCIFIDNQDLKNKLDQFLFKNVDLEDSSAKLTNFFKVISTFNLQHLFIFEKLYTTLKQYIFQFFDSLNTEYFKFMIDKIMEKVFDENIVNNQEYKYFLIVFLFLFYYITNKLTQDQIPNPNIEFQTHDKNLEIVNYSSIEDYLQSQLPTNLKILSIIQKIFQIEDNLIEKQLIVQYSTFADLQENVRVQIQDLFENYIRNFKIENVNIIEKLNKLNSILESFVKQKEFSVQQRDYFIPLLTTTDLFQIYFLRKDNPEFVPVIFKQDILNFVFKRLYYFGNFNIDEYFFSFVNDLIRDVEDQVTDLFQKNLQIAFYLQFTMFNIQNPSQQTIKTFSLKVQGVIKYISKQKEQLQEDNLKFVNLCLYKSISLMIFGNIKQFLTHGKFFKKFIEQDDQPTEYKMISYAIFSDFLLSHNYKDIHQAFLDSQKDENNVLLDMNQVVDDLRQEFWQQKDSVLQNLLCSSFCKLIFNNPKVFQALGIQDIEILACLMIKWKDKNLKSDRLTDLATIQLLTIFFFRTNMLNEKSNYKIIWSFVTILNLVKNLKKNNEQFNDDIIQVDINKNSFIEELTQEMINFTCLLKYKQMQQWRFSNYFDLRPQEVIFCYFLKNPQDIQMVNFLDKKTTYFSFLKFTDERILRFLNTQLLNLKQQLLKYRQLQKYQLHIQEKLDNIDRDMLEGIANNDQYSLQKQKEIEEEQLEIETSLQEKWEEYDKLALIFCKSLREFKVVVPANNQIKQIIKIYQMLESNKEFFLIDQYRISQQLDEIINFFDVIRAFSTKSHNHIKVLVHLVNNLIESDDFLNLIDSTLFTKGEFKLKNFAIQDDNNNNLQNMSSTQLVGSVKKEQNPLVNELLKHQDSELDKISLFIEKGKQNTNNLKDQLQNLMSKIQNMQIGKSRSPQTNRDIDIINNVDRNYNTKRTSNNQSVNNPRDFQSYRNEIYKNRSQIQDMPNGHFDTRRASDQELFFRSRPASIDKELYDRLRDRKNKLKQENYKKDQQIQDLQDALDSFKKKIEPVLNFNDEQTENIRKYKNQIKKLQQEIKDYKSMLENKQNDIPDMYKENLQMKQQLGDQKQIIQQLKNQLAQDKPQNQLGPIPFSQFEKDDNDESLKNKIEIKRLREKYKNVLDQLDNEKRNNKILQGNLNDTSQKLQESKQRKINIEKGNVSDLLKCVYQ